MSINKYTVDKDDRKKVKLYNENRKTINIEMWDLCFDGFPRLDIIVIIKMNYLILL